MAWNEPGNGQDPWGGGRKDSNGGPPDLDQLWRRLRARLSKGGGGGNGGSGGGAGPNPVLLLWVIPVIIVIWLLTGFYMVQPGEQGVLLRFGKYTQTISSGWHWYRSEERRVGKQCRARRERGSPTDKPRPARNQ